ncbi:flagellin domain-containing protein [Pseudomonas sp. CLCA07]
MALTVNTNVASLNVQKNLNRASDALSTSMTRLSSGLKINSAKDDAAGLQIATRMTSQIRGQTMAIKNANDGISMAQTAEGALQESSNILQRMRELGVQARNGSNTAADNTAMDTEYQQMAKELDRIAGSTNLNGTKLLDGSAGVVNIQVGSGTTANDTIGVDFGIVPMDSTIIGATPGDLTDATNAGTAITNIDTALDKVNALRSTLGAAQNRLTSTISNLQNVNENVSAALGRVQDTDFAAETAQMTKQQTLQQASTAILAQANQLPSAVLKLLQ